MAETRMTTADAIITDAEEWANKYQAMQRQEPTLGELFFYLRERLAEHAQGRPTQPAEKA